MCVLKASVVDSSHSSLPDASGTVSSIPQFPASRYLLNQLLIATQTGSREFEGLVPEHDKHRMVKRLTSCVTETGLIHQQCPLTCIAERHHSQPSCLLRLMCLLELFKVKHPGWLCFQVDAGAVATSYLRVPLSSAKVTSVALVGQAQSVQCTCMGRLADRHYCKEERGLRNVREEVRVDTQMLETARSAQRAGKATGLASLAQPRPPGPVLRSIHLSWSAGLAPNSAFEKVAYKRLPAIEVDGEGAV